MPRVWTPSEYCSAKATIISFNVGSTRLSLDDHSLLDVLYQLFGLYLAGYAAIKLNHVQPFATWLENEAEEPTPFDAATNRIALLAVALNGCFLGTLFAAIAAVLGKVGPSRGRKWLTTDTNYPYHVWLGVGSVALSLDYVAAVMFFTPRSLLIGAFLAIWGPTQFVYMYSGVRSRYPPTNSTKRYS